MADQDSRGAPFRAGAPRPADNYPWLPGAMAGAFVVGVVACAIFVRTRPVVHRFEPVDADFGLWVVIVSLVTGYALAVAVYSIAWLRSLPALAATVRRGDVVLWFTVPVGLLAIVIGAIITIRKLGTSDESLDGTLANQTVIVTFVTALCALPALASFLALRSLARDDEHWRESDTAAVHLILRLRSELRILLALLGGLLTLIVIATGQRRTTLLLADPTERIPEQAVLLYGAAYAALVGIAFLAANTAIDSRAGRMLDAAAPIPDPAAADLSARLQRRSDLGALLGLESSRRTFESSVVVAAPLLSAIIATAIGS